MFPFDKKKKEISPNSQNSHQHHPPATTHHHVPPPLHPLLRPFPSPDHRISVHRSPYSWNLIINFPSRTASTPFGPPLEERATVKEMLGSRCHGGVRHLSNGMVIVREPAGWRRSILLVQQTKIATQLWFCFPVDRRRLVVLLPSQSATAHGSGDNHDL